MVGLAREALDAFNRQDFDRAIQLIHPDAVLVRPGGLPEVRGTAAVRAWMEPDAIEAQDQQLLGSEATGPRTLLTRNRVLARGTASGIEMEFHTWNVWTFDDDGLMTRFEYFLDHDEGAARRSAGLGD